MVMSKKYRDDRQLGKFLKQLMVSPDSVLDTDQFELFSGNHIYTATDEIVHENSKCPANFQRLRCKVFIKPDDETI